MWISIFDNKTDKKLKIYGKIEIYIKGRGKGLMLLLKDRVVYNVNKLYIEYNHKGDIDIYTLVIETMNKEEVCLYAHDSKNIIEFIFDAIVAQINIAPHKIVDVGYIVDKAYE